ncbi:TonB-dependent vitamin B12 receptor [Vibrio panuliri]|uniref:Vitamin B12 transporter BtuB n=1 Tax=Vibrio panuliri TaxID=1381081 RepID=A0A1Q9HHC5_9VIBR|nr:TonB-dependent vitamin B12 receptor [Vibrio panuliri]OLQ89393.1 TonB-dependent vitamin B12 receptor [Vibrio panuliri]
MNRTILAVAVGSLLSHAPYSLAEQADETIVVTANRFEQPVNTVLAPVNIVTREEIEQTQAKSLPEILRKLPGVEITQNGGRGQLASIFVRGTSSDQVLVLVDGVRMAKSSTGAVDFNQIPVMQIERVEYIRGARAAMYGSEAIGGVINIITYAKAGQVGTSSLSVGVGSRGQDANVMAAVKTSESGTLKLNAGYEKDEGYNINPIEGVNDGEKYGFDSLNGSLGYDHQFNEQFTGSVLARAYRNNYQYNDSTTVRKKAEVEIETQVYSGSLGYKQGDFGSVVTYSHENTDSRTFDPYNTALADKYQNKYKQDNVSWINSYAVDNDTQLSAGVDWRKDSYEKPDTANSLLTRKNLGFFGVVSTRYNILTAELSARSDDNEDYGRNTTYNAGLGIDITENAQLFGSYGTAYKAPTLSQQNGSAWADANPNLRPESSKNYELGARGDISGIRWGVTGYDIRIDDLITYTPRSGQKAIYENVEGVSRIKGVELELGFDTGLVSHTLSADFKDPKDSDDKQLARRAKKNFKWHANASFGDVDVSTSYLYFGERPDGSETLEAYDLLDVAATYWVQPDLAIRARIDNLLDEEYETAKGYPAPERSFYLNMTYQF